MAPEDEAGPDNAKTAIATAVNTGLEAIRDLGRFFSTILGPGLQELGGSFNDWAKTVRYENTLKLRDRVEAIHKTRRLEGKTVPIPLRIAVPLLENATLEDDALMQEMWASLIANATDPKHSEAGNKRNVAILSNLEPLDAKVLQALAQPPRKPGSHGETFESFEDLLRITGATDAHLSVAIQNLGRLGCVDALRETEHIRLSQHDVRLRETSATIPIEWPLTGTPTTRRTTYTLSELGRALVSACSAAHPGGGEAGGD